MTAAESAWPALPLDAWSDTYATLHLWTQIAGKVRLSLTPRVNHWWNATFYVNARGLTTSLMPYANAGCEIQFDFADHRLLIVTTAGGRVDFALEPRTVADFYGRLTAGLKSLGIPVLIDNRPQEIANAIPFDQDEVHAAYDPAYAQRFWRILVSAVRVFEQFRTRFIGKCSPVHFFWGSFDLACTRFSGKTAPPRKGVITSEAYSHECISAGFWPGMGFGAPAFYSYTAPEPSGLRDTDAAKRFWNPQLSEFILPYDDVRGAADPDAVLMDFLESTYAAGAACAKWDRLSLERE